MLDKCICTTKLLYGVYTRISGQLSLSVSKIYVPIFAVSAVAHRGHVSGDPVNPFDGLGGSPGPGISHVCGTPG